MTGHHAIATRIDALHEQWAEFIDSDASILRWCVRADEVRMVDAFVRIESHEHGGRLPGLFIRVIEPCDGPDYGRVVARDIASQWTAAEAADEIEAGVWDPVLVGPSADETVDLAAFLDSLHANLAELMDYVVLVLTPTVIADGDAWMIFLGRLALQLGPAIKILVLDDADAPAVERLADALGPKLLTRTAGLDMPSAYLSLAKAAATRDHPGSRFRIAFTNLCVAARSADLATVEQHVADAMQAAGAADAPALAVAVALARGNVLQRQGDIEGAVSAFDAARFDAASSPPEVAAKLDLICTLARGAALVQAGDFARAAQTYREAATLASSDDPPACVEAWRMASYCHERARDDDLAWAAGQDALAVADELAPEQRRHSTLAYLGAALISLAERIHPEQVVDLELWMIGLMGTRAWRPS
jgi:tetratricopeptide (TPR) repeat protein